jgi:hypothetical protein
MLVRARDAVACVLSPQLHGRIRTEDPSIQRLPLSPRRCPALPDDDEPCMLLGRKEKKENLLDV